MTKNTNPKCIQLDEVVDPEAYLALVFEGLQPLIDAPDSIEGNTKAED